jgi:hypothetical protein
MGFSCNKLVLMVFLLCNFVKVLGFIVSQIKT